MNKKGVENYMILTILGGAAFLGCQAWEWTHLLTSEHFVLTAAGTLEGLNTTVSHNPWGHEVHGAAVVNALSHSSPEVLRSIILEEDHSATAASLQNLSLNELVEKATPIINEGAIRIGQPGPASFGSYFFGITAFMVSMYSAVLSLI